MRPPGPTLHPLRQTGRWLRDTYAFLDDCRARHGETFTVRMAGYSPILFSSESDLLHAVFTGDTNVFLAGKGNDILVPFHGDHSLLTLAGPRHARDRRLLTPPFHGQRMRAYGRAIQGATGRAIAEWQNSAMPHEVRTQPVMQATSLEIILTAVFGVEEGPQLTNARATLAALLDAATPGLLFLPFLRVDLGKWSAWGRYRRRRVAAEALVQGQIALRRSEPGEDILSLLLAARDEAGAPLTEPELWGELVTLLVAGHETTANALAWALAWIGSERAVYDRLVAEVDAAGDDPEALAKLPYLGAVCNEVLRIRPVFPIVMRVLGAPWAFDAWSLSAGDRVAPCVYLVHTREDLYPDPDRFRPERFLERSFGPTEFLPFGGGARRCIGAAFALYEMKIALATVLQRVRFTAERPKPERRNLAIGPADGARVTVTEVRKRASPVEPALAIG